MIVPTSKMEKGGVTVNRKILASLLTTLSCAALIALVVSAQAPGGSHPEPYLKYNFLVEIDGITQAKFSEVTGLNVTVDVIEFREGGDQTAPILIPGLAHYGPLVLKNGLTQSNELCDWMQATVNGSMTRRNLSIIILNAEGSEEARYNLYEAWPSSWSLSQLESLGVGPIVEELVIQYEKFEPAN
jgi:phage tail-like protein